MGSTVSVSFNDVTGLASPTKVKMFMLKEGEELDQNYKKIKKEPSISLKYELAKDPVFLRNPEELSITFNRNAYYAVISQVKCDKSVKGLKILFYVTETGKPHQLPEPENGYVPDRSKFPEDTRILDMPFPTSAASQAKNKNFLVLTRVTKPFKFGQYTKKGDTEVCYMYVVDELNMVHSYTIFIRHFSDLSDLSVKKRNSTAKNNDKQRKSEIPSVPSNAGSFRSRKSSKNLKIPKTIEDTSEEKEKPIKEDQSTLIIWSLVVLLILMTLIVFKS